MSFTERGEVPTKAEGPHHLERTNSNVCAWLIAVFGLIASGLLLVVILEPLIPGWSRTVLTSILAVSTLVFAGAQGKKYPFDEDTKIADIGILRMTIASMLVPLYFCSVAIIQYADWINGHEEPLPLILLTGIALLTIFLIGCEYFYSRFSKLFTTKITKAIYTWIVTALGTIAATIGIDAITGIPVENFLGIVSVSAFFLIAIVLTLGYFSQVPKTFTSKLVDSDTKIKPKSAFIIFVVAVGWFVLSIATHKLQNQTAIILAIIIITASQTYSVEKTNKWIFG